MDTVKWPPRMRVIDASEGGGERELLYPFAFDEVYSEAIGGGDLPAVHIWRHPRAFVLGLRDRRLPHALKAMRWLERQGYSVAVRNSGGAAVPLDSGVVNLSLLLPATKGKIEMERDFETMRRLIAGVLAEWNGATVAKGEILGSYCPGEYDLSLRGMKFCGIAQRRRLCAYAIQAFVTVEGPGWQRAETARDFYRIAAADADSAQFPRVHPEAMASLSELLGGWTGERWIKALINHLGKHTELAIQHGYPPELSAAVDAMAGQMRQRYDPGSPPESR